MCISSFIAYAFLKQLQGTRPEPEAGSPFWRLASTKAPAICHLNFLDTEDGRGVMTNSKELPNFTISVNFNEILVSESSISESSISESSILESLILESSILESSILESLNL